LKVNDSAFSDLIYTASFNDKPWELLSNINTGNEPKQKVNQGNWKVFLKVVFDIEKSLNLNNICK